MQELDQTVRAFTTFSVLTGDADAAERSHLFRNLAQLYSFVSGHCDDDQVSQYDDVLCQLVDLVEVEARSHVAKLLAPLERAPGTVVSRLANDVIEVARPLLQFSNVLSDDDLIDIINTRSEAHREAIAGRDSVAERVGEAIADQGGACSVIRLVGNKEAELSPRALERLVERAGKDRELAQNLRGRNDIDWLAIRNAIGEVAGQVVEQLGFLEPDAGAAAAGAVNTVVYNRMRNRAGFNAQEWKMAWNQVKALHDRKQLDIRALNRFARFGYGHHAATGLTVMLGIGPDVFVKWLASQDYLGFSVALRALGITPDLFAQLLPIVPWRELPSAADREKVVRDFAALGEFEAQDIFELWRAHAFRKRNTETRALSA